MQKENPTQMVPTQMIVEYTEDCINKQLHEKLPLDVRRFIESIENWDLHYPNPTSWTGDLNVYEKEQKFINDVMGSGVFKLIKSAKIRTLFLCKILIKIKMSDIKILVSPKYERLQWLSLTQNQILNIEDIAFLDAPALERLDLNRNHISNSKALSKTNFKRLNRLNIQTNPIKSLDLSRGNWAVQIENFHIEGTKDVNSKDPRYEHSGPIEWIFKLNSQKAKNINTRWSIRIKQLHYLPIISQRFNKENKNWTIFDH